ncbi:hypothetical protein IZU99_03115 [Oscillospiraceae bacterium CM]|nr:hypothetical protein IZU99_03115 [Oscillospiraceae bacterium CM]
MNRRKDSMQTILQKITSRKFLMAIGGVVTGIVLVTSGSKTEGIAAIISSILGYLIMEGYVDAKAIQNVVSEVKDVADKIDVEDMGDGE